jgi:hypothetical protein
MATTKFVRQNHLPEHISELLSKYQNALLREKQSEKNAAVRRVKAHLVGDG